jgi:hypothetical protein
MSWEIRDKHICNGPTLLITLDLNDPKLGELNKCGLQEIPLASHIDCNTCEGAQRYIVDNQKKSIQLIWKEINMPSHISNNGWMDHPLPEKMLNLRPMKRSECPINEDLYWKSCESFTGGAAFIRVLGPPIWLQYPETGICSSGHIMKYIASIGYENAKSQKYIGSNSFFIAEGALYFFLCSQCKEILVKMQFT